jgi:RNA-splicing ligase RtcB
MLTLRGRYNTADVFNDSVEATAVSQIINLLNQPFTENASIRIMPDVHAGAGCVIGFTADLREMVIPNLIGVDIGCGMLVVDVTESVDFAHSLTSVVKLDEHIHNAIPAGFSIHNQNPIAYKYFENMVCFNNLYKNENFGKAIGTLGGGNHFIELDYSKQTGKTYLVIHSGSRNMGKQVADYYQKLAIAEHGEDFPKDLCFLTGAAMQDYLHDMEICQLYASTNRTTMAWLISKAFTGMEIDNKFETIHNYLNFEDGIMRKGAVSARAGETLIIPLNMRDGSLLCIGKGNPEWNFSAPHGAGRSMSRGQAKRELSMADYNESMAGIYSTCVNQATLDESAMAYKPMEEIVKNITDTVDIIDTIKPIYNFKSG